MIIGTAPQGLIDFDTVVLNGRMLVVGTDGGRIFTWDSLNDRWTTHGFAPGDEQTGPRDITAIAAAAVDGRIVLGGGEYLLAFAQWELDGRLRRGPRGQDGGVSAVSTVEHGDRTLFVSGGTGPSVHLWDARTTEPYAAIWHELEECGRVAVGTWRDRLVVAGTKDNRFRIWDVDAGGSLAEFDSPESQFCDHPDDEVAEHFADPEEGLTYFGLATYLVAAGDQAFVIRDLDADGWYEPLTIPGGTVTCLDAGHVDGRPVAVTGGDDGTVCVWDLENRHLLSEPFTDHLEEVSAVRLARLEGRPVAVSASADATVRVRELAWE
ncbi:WD40 repeat domain-containing protein [Streptomyces sp. NBC_01775]|uniref:WD40 repeat domain-containing protein n=1 Tax=Streptomyces sp. NBC_01775 TaxID=2975939 RepID=UPI002DDAB0B0|nr:WD40 repeat domain-containing protein [Streptomyces sp. NBC_01775]WSB78708.1 WD40 repeat domain-containing protein [Streptomyces sp. NBC_01775]